MKTALLLLSLVTLQDSTEFMVGPKEILTSYAWSEETQKSNQESLHIFRKNGEYIIKDHNIKITGQWFWTGEDEIFTLTNEITIDTLTFRMTEGLGKRALGYYVRIIQINDKELKTLERHEGDSWDSGFAKERKYLAQEL